MNFMEFHIRTRVQNAAVSLAIVAGIGGAGQAQMKPKPAAEPDPIEQHFQSAQTFQLAGDLSHAADEYRKAISAGLERLGNLRISQQKYGEAKSLLTNAIGVDSSNTGAAISLAVADFYMGDLDQAKSLLEPVLTREPSNFRALNLMGKLEFVKGNFQAAADHLQAALGIQADFDVAYSLALANLELKKLPQATVLFDEMKASMKSSPELHMLIGRAYRQSGYAEQAAGEFEKAISLNPKAPHAHSLLGQTYLMDPLKRYGDAKNQFEAELALDPKDSLSRYYLGVAEFQLHELREADATLQRVARERPDNPDVLLYLGQVYLAQSRPDEAAAALRKAIAVGEKTTDEGPSLAAAHSFLAEALDKQQKTAEAAAERAAAEKLSNRRSGMAPASAPDVNESSRVQRGEMIAQAAVPLPTKSAEAGYVKSVSEVIGEAYHNLGVIDARDRKYSSAADEFAAAADWNPGIATLNRNWGIAAFRAERFDRAITPLARELEHTPDDSVIRQMLAVSYFMVDDYAKSAKVFRPILEELPDNPGLLYAAGMSLVRSGDSATAGKLFSRMLEHGANIPEIHLVLGEAYSQQSQYAEALREFQTAAQLNPRLADVHYYTGMVLFKEGKLDEATKEFNAELDLNPRSVPARYQIAYIDLQLHQSDDAIRLLSEVLKEKPSYADAHYQLGKALLETNKLPDAIEHLETATKLQPNEAYGFYQLSVAYRRAGRLQDATNALQKYQQLKEKVPRPSPM